MSSSIIEKFKLNNNLSVEFWLKLESANGSIDIFATDSFKMTLYSGGVLKINNKDSYNLVKDPFQSVNIWQHICVIMNSTDSALYLYQNSIEVLKVNKRFEPKLSSCTNIFLVKS